MPKAKRAKEKGQLTLPGKVIKKKVTFGICLKGLGRCPHKEKKSIPSRKMKCTQQILTDIYVSTSDLYSRNKVVNKPYKV